jgi:DNA replication protein DnaC
MYSLEENIIDIRPPEKVNEEGVKDINKEVLLNHFCTLIVGVPGSGKSHLLHEIVSNPNLYYKKFDFVFIISPSELDGFECDVVN